MSHGRMHWPWPLLLGLALWTAASPSIRAAEPSVRIGHLSVSRRCSDRSLLPVFREEMRRQVAQLPAPKKAKPRLVVSGSVLRLHTTRRNGRRRARCVVSARVERADTGALVATIKGKATVEDDLRTREGETKREALRRAVRTTVRSLSRLLR